MFLHSLASRNNKFQPCNSGTNHVLDSGSWSSSLLLRDDLTPSYTPSIRASLPLYPLVGRARHRLIAIYSQSRAAMRSAEQYGANVIKAD